MKLLGLSTEQTTALCHVVGVGGAIATLLLAHATAAYAFGHNLHMMAGDAIAVGWVPNDTLLLLEGGLIAGGILNDKFNTPVPEAGKNGEPK